jgi:demethylspheroidene O-methyltransferase
VTARLQRLTAGTLGRLQASRTFVRRAIAFPLTRAMARRRARGLFDLCAGFVYSQVLYAGVRLGLFRRLQSGACHLNALAAELGLSRPMAERLVRAAAALRLVGEEDGLVWLGPLGAGVLATPGLESMIEHHALLYADLAEPVALLRGARDTALSRYWSYARAERPSDVSAADAAAYSALMAGSVDLLADEILGTVSFSDRSCLLDVGGGEGRFACAALLRWPQLRAIVFDLPAVAERAQIRLAQAGLAARAHAVGGDFLVDDLPAGADCIALVRVTHDHDDAGLAQLLAATRRALPRGGRLILAEPMADPRFSEPMADAYFGFYLLAMGQGRPRSAPELTRHLEAAGFGRIRQRRTRLPLVTSVLVAQV